MKEFEVTLLLNRLFESKVPRNVFPSREYMRILKCLNLYLGRGSYVHVIIGTLYELKKQNELLPFILFTRVVDDLYHLLFHHLDDGYVEKTAETLLWNEMFYRQAVDIRETIFDIIVELGTLAEVHVLQEFVRRIVHSDFGILQEISDDERRNIRFQAEWTMRICLQKTERLLVDGIQKKTRLVF